MLFLCLFKAKLSIHSVPAEIHLVFAEWSDSLYVMNHLPIVAWPNLLNIAIVVGLMSKTKQHFAEYID